MLNIDNTYFDRMIKHIYSSEQNKLPPDTKVPFLDLHLSISDDFVSSKIYDKGDDFIFDLVNVSFLGDEIPRATSLLRNLYISLYAACWSVH